MKTIFITRARRFALLALVFTLAMASNFSLSSAHPAASPMPPPPAVLTVVGWGDNQACQATPPSCISGVTAISAGAVHSLTLQGQSCVQVGCSPQQGLALLIAQVEALITGGTLTQNQGAGLIDKLDQVIAKLDAGQTGAACNQLNSFINKVNAFINNGSLTQAQGQALIDAANAIRPASAVRRSTNNYQRCSEAKLRKLAWEVSGLESINSPALAKPATSR